MSTNQSQQPPQAKDDSINCQTPLQSDFGGYNNEKRRITPQRQRSSRSALDKMSITECSNEDDSEENEKTTVANNAHEKYANNEKTYDANDARPWRLNKLTGSLVLCETSESSDPFERESFLSQLSMDQSELLESRTKEERTEDQVEDGQIPRPRRSSSKSKIGPNGFNDFKNVVRPSRLPRLLSTRSITSKEKRANQKAFQFNVANIIDDRPTERMAFPGTNCRMYKSESTITTHGSDSMLLPWGTRKSENDLVEVCKDLETQSESGKINDSQSVNTSQRTLQQIMEYSSFSNSKQHICEETRSSVGMWETIRSNLFLLPPAEARDEIENVNHDDETVLHICCRNSPPPDIIDTILAISRDVACMPCARDNLPLHVECEHGANLEIIKRLIEAYPDGVSAVNAEGRTPLHLACRNKTHPPSFEVLHLLMTSSESMSAVEIINSVDGQGNSPITLKYLCERVISTSDQELVDNAPALSCLTAYLDAKLELCYKLSYTDAMGCIALLEETPSWFRETAAVHPYVRAILNWRITRTFSMGTLLMDGYINLVVIVCFRIASFESRTARFVAAAAAQSCVEDVCVLEDGYGDKGVGGVSISLLYIGAMYMSLRELLQATSMAHQGQFKNWLFDFWNVADCFSITSLLISTAQMHHGLCDDDTFRLLTIITTGFLWIEALSILKTINHNFAVFINGMTHMALTLRPFLCTMGLFLVAFAQMYLSNYQATDSCPISSNTNTSSLSDFSLKNNFCTLTNSYLKVYMMFVGNGVNESEFMNNSTSLMLSVTFSFVILILLLNILIAIVTDSYGEIAKKSENVFWCERMSFVFEVDQTYTFLGLITRKINQTVFFFNDKINDDDDDIRDYNKFGEASTTHVLARNLSLLWDIAMIVFENPTSVNTKKLEGNLKRRWRPVGLLKYINPDKFLSSMIQYGWMRFGVAIFLPFWILLGFLSAGILWPPQLKRWLLCPCIKEGIGSEQVTKMDMQDMSEEVSQNFGIMGDKMKDDWNDVHLRIDEAYAGMERIEREQRQIKNEVSELRSEMCDMHNSIRDIKKLLTDVVNRTSDGVNSDKHSWEIQ